MSIMVSQHGIFQCYCTTGGILGHCQHADRNIRLSRDNDSEITHAMAGRMFAEVEEDVIML